MWKISPCVSIIFFLFQGFLFGSEFWEKKEESFTDKVVILQVGEKSLLTKQNFLFLEKTLRRCEEEKAKAVLFDIHTPGGLAWETSDLMMEVLAELKVSSLAFVNSKALSAGALIAMSTDDIYMRPVSTIGAAGVVSAGGKEMDEVMRAKLDSSFDAFARSVIAKKGHRVDIARAMMFKDEQFSFGDLSIRKGSLLTLTADEAIQKFEGKNLLAKGLANSIDEVLSQEGLGGIEKIKARPTPFGLLAQWVQYISPFLIMLGLAGIYFEIKTPGIGIGALIGLGAFLLFFFGNHIAGNLAGYELFFGFLLAVLLIFIDIFLLGIGFLSLIGGVLVFLFLLSSMLDSLSIRSLFSGDFSAFLDSLFFPLLSLLLGILGALLLVWLFFKKLRKLHWLREIAFDEKEV